MTVSTTNNRIAYTGNGSTTVFSFPYKFIATSDIVVYVAGVLQSTGYTVGTPGDSGANITFTTAPASLASVVILSDPSKLQSTSLPSTGPFPAKSVETMSDKLTLLVQRLADRINRSMTLSDADVSTASLTLPTPAANQLVGWNPTATALQNVDQATLVTSIAYGTAKSDIFTGTGSQTAFTLTANPGALNNLDVAIGGVTQLPGTDYTWISGTTVTFTTAPPNGAKVLIRYMQALALATSDAATAVYTPAGTGAVATTVQAKLRQTVSVMDFGARGDGTTNDTAAIQAAIDAVALAGGGAVFVPPGQYQASQIKLKTRVKFYGAGWKSRLSQISGSNQNFVVLNDVNVEWTQFSDMMVDGNRFGNTSGDAINYNNTGGSFTFFDPNHIINNILIYTAAGSGLVLTVNCRESKVTNVFVTGANGNGFYLACTDSTFVNCTTGAAGLTGWSILGPNNRFTACKSFGSGRLVTAGNPDGAGFSVTQPRQMLATCEAQDNGWHGFLFLGANNCTASALIADSNGTNTSGVGFRFDASSYCTLVGDALNRDANTSQKYALEFANSTTNNAITVTSQSNSLGTFSGTVGANFVVVNGSWVNYVEGTWTPTITSVTGLITSYTATGTYTKIGRQVTLILNISMTNNGTGSGGLIIAGVPYAIGSTAIAGYGRNDTLGVSVNGAGINSNLYINKYDGTHPVATGQTILFTATYFV